MFEISLFFLVSISTVAVLRGKEETRELLGCSYQIPCKIQDCILMGRYQPLSSMVWSFKWLDCAENLDRIRNLIQG
jgi:hypothetical protein